MSTPYTVAAVLPPGPAEFVPAVHRAAAAGFAHVEVTALVERPAEYLDALADTGLFVACASLGQGLGAGCVAERRLLLARQKRQVLDAARLGARLVYLVPPAGAGEEVLACFTEGCSLLAEFAAGRMVQLAVLPVQGTCLAEAETALAWLERAEGVSLALDAPRAHDVLRAGQRLAHVRLERKTDDARALVTAGFRGIVAVTRW